MTTLTTTPPYPLVYIEWDDSYGCSPHWSKIPKKFLPPEPIICRSVGWLVHDGDKHKVIVPHLTQPSKKSWDGCGDMTIPAAVIVRLVHLDLPA
jgi:hypothetical protein